MTCPTEIFSHHIIFKIKALGQGAVFTPKDFLDIAKRGMVDVMLKTLLQQGTIRRLARGLYDVPKHSAILNTELSPDIDAVAKADCPAILMANRSQRRSCRHPKYSS